MKNEELKDMRDTLNKMLERIDTLERKPKFALGQSVYCVQGKEIEYGCIIGISISNENLCVETKDDNEWMVGAAWAFATLHDLKSHFKKEIEKRLEQDSQHD